MKNEKIKYIIKIVAFLLAVTVVFVTVTNILYEKCYFSIKLNSPETENWTAFYEEPKNSIDVIFLGSSHTYNDIVPSVFYEETGLTGFDMSSSNQDLFLSYTYLQAALQTQKPKYVFLETSRFCKGVFATPYYYYMSFDAMKWDKVKIDALKTWQEKCPEEKMVDRIFTLISYHTRYNELTRTDFAPGEIYSTTLNGYIPTGKTKSVTKNEYDIYDGIWGIPDRTAEYIDKINELCIENDIELIFVLNPDTLSRYGISCSIAEAASERDILFLDYNETDRFNSIGLDCDTDFKDDSHLNSFGAEKFTKQLANDLIDMGIVVPEKEENSRWAQKKQDWIESMNLARLVNCNDLDEYLDLLEKTDYTVFVTLMEDGPEDLSDESLNKLAEFGIDCDFKNNEGYSYFGLKTRSGMVNEFSESAITRTGKLSNGVYWAVQSVGNAGLSEENPVPSTSILIGPDECAVGKKGLNFAVFDEETETVIDCVSFSIFMQTLDANR